MLRVHRPCRRFSHARSLSVFVVQVVVLIDTLFTSCLAQDEALCIVHCPEVFTPSMSYATSLMSSTLSRGTRNPSPATRLSSTSSSFFSGEIEPCADPRHVSVGYLS